MPDLRSACRERLPDALALLKQLIAIESPTTDKAAVDRCSTHVETTFHELGLSTERIAVDSVGDQILAEWHVGDAATRVLTILHLDTVWPLGTLEKMPIREENGLLYGPGSFDMKASVAIVWLAVRTLLDQGQTPKHTIRLLFTTDEEVGSLKSAALIESEAKQSKLVLIMEPALASGKLKTKRKGVGGFTISATGRSSHAGGNHERGINAIEELAHHILALQQLTDYSRGTTINVGVIQGGTRSNVIPEHAEIQVDFRVESLEEGERIIETVQALKAVHPEARIEVTGGLKRPPMVRDETMVATFEQARKIGAALGMELEQGSTGGGSDGNLTAAIGVPTLDGLGVIGDGAHARHEHIVIDSLAERAALLASIWMEWE